MKTFVNLAAYILILWGLYGCNDDIFVDDFRSSDSEFSLDGNGDVATIHFASSNWDLLGIYTFDDSFLSSYKVYDENDNLITEEYPYLKGLGKIVCDEKLTDFTLERNNSKELKIIVGENVRDTHLQFSILVGNDYERQEIYVDISSSDRYVFDHVTYSLDAYSYAKKIEEKESFIQFNYRDTPFLCPLFPYEDVRHEVAFESDMHEAFQLLGEDHLSVEIPSMENGRLGMNGVYAQYTATQQSLPLPFPDTKKIEISIPPYVTQRITLLLDYEFFETQYTLYVFHPKTKKQRIVNGTLRSRLPKSYYIKRENIR